MSNKKLAELFGQLAEHVEGAASTLRKIEGVLENEDTKSGGAGDDGVAARPAKSAGKKGAESKAVAGKPAAGAKKKAPAITFDALKEKLSEVMETTGLGKQKVKELLSEFGATKLNDVDESDYADLHEKAVEALAAAADGGDDDDDDMFGDE